MKNLLFILIFLFGATLFAQDPNEAEHNSCEGLSYCECYGDCGDPIDPEKHPDKDKENVLNCETNYDPCTCDGIGCDEGVSVGNNQENKGRPYVAVDSDKLISNNFPKTMPKQYPNTCVTASLEYISKVLGNEINEGAFHLYQAQQGHNVFRDGVLLSDIPNLIATFFTTTAFTSFTAAIDAGYTVMTDLYVDDNNGHNVVIVGYQEDGDLIYMDPETGDLREGSADDFNKNYAIPITGTN